MQDHRVWIRRFALHAKVRVEADKNQHKINYKKSDVVGTESINHHNKAKKNINFNSSS